MKKISQRHKMNNDTRERTLGKVYDEWDDTTNYWLRDGRVFFCNSEVKGADPASFRFYTGSFAKDRNHCYCTSSRLSGANPATFRALNFTYATDGKHVWTIGGRIKDVDAESFVVCDDGVCDDSDGNRAPYGYGKDKERVYYYDFDGTPNWVRKASPRSFESLNDGTFGKDEQFVFCGSSVLPKANVGQWAKIAGNYSRDDRRIYYFNREMKGVDYSSFEVVPLPKLEYTQLAKDKNHFYENDSIIDRRTFEKYSRGDFE